jgi:cholesterol oxidase
VIWPGAGDASYLENCDERLQQCTAALGGTHVPNPTWNKLLDHKLISCHPMGTCAMGESALHGVVDHKGRVFAGETGTAIHPGLYVTDAAVIPRSVGVNPLLTISTLAERALDHLLKDHEWTLDSQLPPLPQPPPSKVGMRFTEKMSGRLGLGETQEFPEDLWGPHAVGTDAMFVVTVHSDDLDEVLDQPSHRARLTGTFHAPGLHPDPMAIQSGEFRLFVDDPLRPGAKTMNYDFEALDEAGKTWTLQGEKRIEDDAGLDLWNDTTHLFTTVYEGAGFHGKVAAKGLLKVHFGDLMVALKSIEVLGARSTAEEFEALARCGKYFIATLAKTYF